MIIYNRKFNCSFSSSNEKVCDNIYNVLGSLLRKGTYSACVFKTSTFLIFKNSEMLRIGVSFVELLTHRIFLLAVYSSTRDNIVGGLEAEAISTDYRGAS